jgi:hypothetical protein
MSEAPNPIARARLLPQWKLAREGGDGAMFVHVQRRMSLIVSSAIEEDGRRWAHISIAMPETLPSWDDLRAVKEQLVGAEWDAYQVLPRASRYVNQHPNCLHLWVCLDSPGVLPDFSRGGTSI